MLGYYVELALRSLRRNSVLTALTIIAVGVGIGASMTVFTVFRAMSGDPIPQKSSRLHAVLIDNMGPDANIDWESRGQVSYRDAIALMSAKRATRQSAMYVTSLSVTPPEASDLPLEALARAASSDFFPMFDVPFRSGSPWTNTDEQERANVVVLTPRLADRLFPGKEAVGRELILNQQPFRVIGVLKEWSPQPHFYDIWSGAEDLFVPFATAVEREFRGNYNACNKAPPYEWSAFLNAECIWINFWAELPDESAAKSYEQFLGSYAAEQRQLGRFNWAPKTGLYDLRRWLARMHVVPDDVRVATLVAFGFLAVCLLNAVSLMLAKFTARVGNLSVHRALGASRLDVFAQCLTETAILGAAGGVLGLALTGLGLGFERMVMTEGLAPLAQLDSGMAVITLSLAVLTTLACGVYPSWRASQAQPALQLKAQ